MQSWLVVGATSGIATPLVRELAKRGHHLLLWDRPEADELLQALRIDIETRYGNRPVSGHFNATDYDSHNEKLDSLENSEGPIYGVVWIIGVMGDQVKLQESGDLARMEHEVNYSAALSFLNLIASRMEKRRFGHIVGLGSAAGDRGRATNYIYGSSKAALHSLLQGLRQRLALSGVTVTTVKPGPVRTPMTAGLTGLPLLAEPEQVASDIAKGIDRQSEIIYTPGIWRLIMFFIRHVPEFIFKRLNF